MAKHITTSASGSGECVTQSTPRFLEVCDGALVVTRMAAKGSKEEVLNNVTRGNEDSHKHNSPFETEPIHRGLWVLFLQPLESLHGQVGN